MFQSLRRATKWIIIVVVIAFGGTLLYVGGVDLLGGSGPASAEMTVAEVNGWPLRADQLNYQVAQRVQQLQSGGARVSGITRESVRYDALQDLIVQSLLEQAADEMRISVDSAEVAQAVDAIRAQFPDNESYREALRQINLTETQLRAQVEAGLRLQHVQEQAVGDVQVTDDEVARAYEAVHLKQLIVPVEGDEDGAWEAAQRKAAALRERVAQGSPFEEVAEGDEQVTSSDLGFVGRDASLPEAIVDAAFRLEEGQVSEPIRTSNGYRIIQAVEWRRAQGEAFEEERETLRQQLLAEKRQEAYSAWLAQRRSEAEITILDPALEGFDKLVADDLEGAEAAFRRAIAAEPENAYLHAILAEVLAQREELDQAILAAQEAVNLFDGDPELHLLLGNLLREAERPDEAVAQYQKASELSPYDFQLHLSLFGAYLEMGREEEAEAERARLQEIQELLAERQRLQQELAEQAEEPEAPGEEAPASQEAAGAGAEAGSASGGDAPAGR